MFPIIKNLQHDDDDNVCDCKQHQNRFRQAVQIASDIFDFIFKVNIRIFRCYAYICILIGNRHGKHDRIISSVDFAEPRGRYRLFKVFGDIAFRRDVFFTVGIVRRLQSRSKRSVVAEHFVLNRRKRQKISRRFIRFFLLCHRGNILRCRNVTAELFAFINFG